MVTAVHGGSISSLSTGKGTLMACNCLERDLIPLQWENLGLNTGHRTGLVRPGLKTMSLASSNNVWCVYYTAFTWCFSMRGLSFLFYKEGSWSLQRKDLWLSQSHMSVTLLEPHSRRRGVRSWVFLMAHVRSPKIETPLSPNTQSSFIAFWFGSMMNLWRLQVDYSFFLSHSVSPWVWTNWGSYFL